MSGKEVGAARRMGEGRRSGDRGRRCGERDSAGKGGGRRRLEGGARYSLGSAETAAMREVEAGVAAWASSVRE